MGWRPEFRGWRPPMGLGLRYLKRGSWLASSGVSNGWLYGSGGKNCKLDSTAATGTKYCCRGKEVLMG